MYTEMLIKIKNAESAGKKTVKLPYNKFDYSVAEVLADNKFVASVEKRGKGYKRVMGINLNEAGSGIRGLKFFSKSSRRFYVGYKDLRSVRQGYGTAVLSTSKGVMTDKNARKSKMGGELLFHIW